MQIYDPPGFPRELSFAAGAMNSPDICWVCGTHKDEEKLDHHHVVPRSFGGGDGPVVGLCQPCHRKVHEMGMEQSSVPVNAGREAARRLHVLASAIKRAADKTRNDPNKTIVYMDRFEARTRKHLIELSHALKMPQRNVVRLALSDLHRKVMGV